MTNSNTSSKVRIQDRVLVFIHWFISSLWVVHFSVRYEKWRKTTKDLYSTLKHQSPWFARKLTLGGAFENRGEVKHVYGVSIKSVIKSV